MMPPKKDTQRAGKETGRKSVETDTDRNPDDSCSGYISKPMSKITGRKGTANEDKNAGAHEPKPEGYKKEIDERGEAGGKNKRPLNPLDNSDDDNTHNSLPQPNSSNSTNNDTEGAQRGIHYRTVWGLRLDLLLMTIVIAYAAIEFKTPLSTQHVAIENPASQQQLTDTAEQCRLQSNEIKKEMKTLKSEVNKNSDENTEQSTKLFTILNDIIKINGILSPSDPDGILTKVRAIKADIADVKNEHKLLQRDFVDVKGKQERSDTYVSTSITDIRKSVTENSDANSALSKYISAVKEDLNDHKLKFDTTSSNVDTINEEMEKANDTVLKVEEIAKNATKMVDEANAKLNIMKEHLFNKDALTAAILILFLLIIGLMLYVLKLKSSLESALAGGSTYRPKKGSREMEAVLQKMPSRPTLDEAVCIVSFNASNSDECKRMIKETVVQLGKVSFRTHVIRKHADIAELPHCRLYIMCVEFTERHVIIEEQGLRLGDLKLTSYRGVGKLGGALVILYIHDPGSRNLTDDQLYSDGVYCVKKQQELKELCEMGRFISAHNKLNTAQKQALETAISRVLNIQAARH